MMAIQEEINKKLRETNLVGSGFPNALARCIACGQPSSIGQFCHYCNEMRDELRCWPK